MPVEVYSTNAPMAVRTTTKVHDDRSIGEKARDVLQDVKDVLTGESNIKHKDIAKAQKKQMELHDKEEKHQHKVEKQAAHLAHLQKCKM